MKRGLIYAGFLALLTVFPLLLEGCGDSARRTSSTYDRSPVISQPVTDPPPATDPEPAPSPVPAPVVDVDLVVHKEVLRLTNEFRASNGRAPLAWNDRLYAAAQSHAEAMATHGFFSHTSPGGSSAGTRISREGYDWYTWGENIAYGYTTAKAVVDAWIKSTGHRANMLNSKFEDLGVGYHVRRSSSGGAGTAYWVQDFGAQ